MKNLLGGLKLRTSAPQQKPCKGGKIHRIRTSEREEENHNNKKKLMKLFKCYINN